MFLLMWPRTLLYGFRLVYHISYLPELYNLYITLLFTLTLNTAISIGPQIIPHIWL